MVSTTSLFSTNYDTSATSGNLAQIPLLPIRLVPVQSFEEYAEARAKETRSRDLGYPSRNLNSLNESNERQENHCTHDSRGDGADYAVCENAESPQDVASNHGSKNANEDVPDDPKPPPSGNHAGQPTRNKTDKEKCEDPHGCTLPMLFKMRSRPFVSSFEIFHCRVNSQFHILPSYLTGAFQLFELMTCNFAFPV